MGPLALRKHWCKLVRCNQLQNHSATKKVTVPKTLLELSKHRFSGAVYHESRPKCDEPNLAGPSVPTPRPRKTKRSYAPECRSPAQFGQEMWERHYCRAYGPLHERKERVWRADDQPPPAEERRTQETHCRRNGAPYSAWAYTE